MFVRLFIRLFAVVSVLATLACMAGFGAVLLGLTPKDVDHGNPLLWGGLGMNLFLLLSFGALHSLLARPRVKTCLSFLLAPAYGRGVYNLIAGLQLIVLALFWMPFPATLWRIESDAGQLLMDALLFGGLGLMVWAVAAIDAWHFLGLRQAFQPAAPAPAFTVRGPYRYLRHPIQAGLILALWAVPHMSVGHALLAAVFTAYAILATLLWEERDLRRELGADYEAYRQAVPALWPRWRAWNGPL